MATETIAQHSGDILTAQDLGSDENPYVRAEVAEDCSNITVIWVEPLRFHLEHYSEDLETLLQPKTDPGDEDEPAYFIDEAREEFAVYMREFLATDKWDVEDADILADDSEEWDGESCVALSYRFDTPNGPATTLDEVGEKVWPFIGAMTNVTDPGTFDNPYVMTALARRITAKHEEG